MSGLELIAAVLGVTAVWLTVKQNAWCWPIGLVMVLIYGWLFFEVKLYSGMLLQVAYAILQLYGWWQWSQGVDDSGRRPVSQAGGQEASDGNDLSDRINRAAKHMAVRLYSQFDAADHDQWSKVLDEARKGNLEALKAVGHTQEADKHPVCQKLLGFIGPGKKGAEIRDIFEAPPFGWPRDAFDGALYALLAAGHIKASDAASKTVDAKSLDRAKLTQASFQRESINITPIQLIKIRKLFDAVGVPCQPKEELNRMLALLAKLHALMNQVADLSRLAN